MFCIFCPRTNIRAYRYVCNYIHKLSAGILGSMINKNFIKKRFYCSYRLAFMVATKSARMKLNRRHLSFFTIDHCYNNKKRPRHDIDILELSVPPNLDEWETVHLRLRNASIPTDRHKLHCTIVLHLGYILRHGRSADMPMIKAICASWALLTPNESTDSILCQVMRLADTDLFLTCLRIARTMQLAEGSEVLKYVSQVVGLRDTKESRLELLDRAIQLVTTSGIHQVHDPQHDNESNVRQLIDKLGSKETDDTRQKALHQILTRKQPEALMDCPDLLTRIARCCTDSFDLQETCLAIFIKLSKDNYNGTILVRIPKVLDAIVVAIRSNHESSMTLLLHLSDTVVNRCLMARHAGILSSMIQFVRNMSPHNAKKSIVKERIFQLAELL